MKKKNASFSGFVSEYRHAEKARKRLMDREKASRTEANRQVQKKTKKKLDTAMAAALTNLSAIISQDQGFREYLADVFRNVGDGLEDNQGICGFPPRALDPRKVKGLVETMPELKDAPPIDPRDKEEVHLSVLVLYQEYESRDRELAYGCANAECRSMRNQILVMSVRLKNQFSQPKPADMTDCRLAIADRSIDRSFGSRYEEPASLSSDPGFMAALHDLTEPSTTFGYFIKRFGPGT